jgi:hypothetical protein
VAGLLRREEDGIRRDDVREGWLIANGLVLWGPPPLAVV